MSNITVESITDENSVIYHEVYIMLSNIFPNMMPYWAFRKYAITVAKNKDNQLVGFMLLKTHENINDLISNSDDVKKIKNNLTKNLHESFLTKKILSIISIGIDPKFRKQGYASQYIDIIKNHFSDYILHLHVSVKNTDAIKLYEKHNFVIGIMKEKYYEDHNFEPYTKEGTNAYQMFYFP